MRISSGTTTAGTAWEVSGPADGVPVVLIHGLGLTSATWDAFVPQLAQRWKVVRYDLVGHGATPPTPDELTLTSFGDQVVDLLDHLSIDAAHLVGFSLGGMINRRVALDAPQRVRSLSILNSPHSRGEEAQRLVEERAQASAAGGPGATIEETLRRWFTPAFLDAEPARVDAVRQTVLANSIDPYAAARWVLANGVVELIEPEPAIQHPTLVMTCEFDSGSTPAMSERIAAEIPNADLRIVPNLQHLGLLEQPELFLDPVCGFLSRVDGNGAHAR